MAALVVLLSFVLVPMAGATQETPPSEKPNIVFILTDDLDTYTLNQMETTRTLLADQGVIFKNATFSDPLCCPSRATMQRGQYPHNTGVETDDPPNGGFETFYPRLEAIPTDMENWRQISTTEFAYHYTTTRRQARRCSTTSRAIPTSSRTSSTGASLTWRKRSGHATGISQRR